MKEGKKKKQTEKFFFSSLCNLDGPMKTPSAVAALLQIQPPRDRVIPLFSPNPGPEAAQNMKTHRLRRGAGHGQGRQEQQGPHFVVELDSHGFFFSLPLTSGSSKKTTRRECKGKKKESLWAPFFSLLFRSAKLTERREEEEKKRVETTLGGKTWG